MEVKILHGDWIMLNPVAAGRGAHGQIHCAMVPFELARYAFFDRKWFTLVFHLAVLMEKYTYINMFFMPEKNSKRQSRSVP